MNRDELEERLKEQRERRQAAGISSSPALRRRKFSTLLVVGVIIVGLGLFAWFAYLSLPASARTLPMETAQPGEEQPHSTIAVSENPTPILSPVTMIVCTGVSNGRMNVHFEPGAGTDVRGYLKEGETVIVAGEGQISSSRWLRLTSPVNGWANARYLCLEENNSK